MNIPPTPETVERVEEWGRMLCDMFAAAPFDVQHSDEVEGHPHSHLFQYDHDTLPGRSMVVMWGIPVHKENCGCIEPPEPCLMIRVMDRDTEQQAEGTGELEFDNPSIKESFIAVIMMSMAAFHQFGTL